MATPINCKTASPGWSAPGVEPPPEFKASGYVAGYKPPAGFFNWFWTLVSKCVTELQDALKTYSTANETDKTGISSALSAHTGSKANPHGVTAAQAGAVPTATLNPSAYTAPTVVISGTTFTRGYVQIGKMVIVNVAVNNVGTIAESASGTRTVIARGFPAPAADRGDLSANRLVSSLVYPAGPGAVNSTGGLEVAIPGAATGYSIYFTGVYLAK